MMEFMTRMPRPKIVEINGSEIGVKETQILKFQTDIEMMTKSSGLGYLEAILEYCDEHGIEVETIKPLISDRLMSMLHNEASTLNLIQQESQLPI